MANVSFEIGQMVSVKAEVKTEYTDKHKDGDGWEPYICGWPGSTGTRLKCMYRRELGVLACGSVERKTSKKVGLLYYVPASRQNNYQESTKFHAEKSVPVYEISDGCIPPYKFLALPEDMETI